MMRGEFKQSSDSFPDSPYVKYYSYARAYTNHNEPNAPEVTRVFGNAGIEHNLKYGSSTLNFSLIAEKNYRNASKNPYA